MAVITPTILNEILDAAVNASYMLIGETSNSYGYGQKASPTYGVVSEVGNAVTALLAADDLDPITALAQSLQSMQGSIDGLAKSASDWSALLTALQGHVTRYQLPNVNNLDSFLKYNNVGSGGTWLALQNPGWLGLASSWQSNQTPSACNMYYEILQGSANPQGMGEFVVGTGYTGGASVPNSSGNPLYAGGFPFLNVSGATGSGLVTVTGTAFNPADQSFHTGMTWTATVSGNGEIALSVGTAPANSFIQSVTGITAAAGLTAGTIYVEGHRPTGRRLLL